MKCLHVPENLDLRSTCQTPATHRDGRRLYCEAHAPEAATKLDRFATVSAMRLEDKSSEYDSIAEHLYHNGWEVLEEGRMPDDGRIVQFWDHPENAARGIHGTHTLTDAYKIECFLDAPRPGKRFTEMMKGLNETIDEKQRARKLIDLVKMTSTGGRCLTKNCGT